MGRNIMNVKQRTLSAAAAVFLLACEGGSAGPGPELSVCERAQALRTQPGFTTVAEEADLAARVLPGGFGGLYQDIGHSLVAYFKESVSFGVKQDLAALLACGGAYPGWAGVLVVADPTAVIVRQGQYTARELLSYFRVLEPLKADPAVWGLEVDPETNRVWLGITDAAQLTRLQQAVTGRGVPLAAVQIEVPPPTTGVEQFEVLDPAIATRGAAALGVFSFQPRVRFTNRQSSTRYPDWCGGVAWSFFLGAIEKWNGTGWRVVYGFTCTANLLAPRAVPSGESVTDSLPVAGVRRLNAGPAWLTARITGTYRFVGRVYTATTPNPQGGPPLLVNLAAQQEQVSTPFRLTNALPF
jgi:hypothetical protein